MSFKNPRQVKDLHMFIKSFGIADTQKALFFRSCKNQTEKPNVIFDVTLDALEKVVGICNYAVLGQYDPNNIHVVWILNDIEMAKSQNLSRDRTIPEDILVSTHVGAAITMKDLLDENRRFQRHIDGDIWIVFNKKKVQIAMSQQNSRLIQIQAIYVLEWLLMTIWQFMSKSKEKHPSHLHRLSLNLEKKFYHIFQTKLVDIMELMIQLKNILKNIKCNFDEQTNKKEQTQSALSFFMLKQTQQLIEYTTTSSVEYE